MDQIDIDLNPVIHITTDAIGAPGNRIFYLQGWTDDRTVTLLIEKFQVQSLAVGVEQFLTEIREKFPELPQSSSEFDEEKMHITPPVEPLFRVGELGLGYEAESDLIVLVAREAQPEESEDAEGSVARFWCTRSQLRALSRWGIEVASRGRPLCPQCRQPMDPEGHFCSKKNGHKR